MQDINQNQQSDYIDALDDIRKRDEYREQMNLKREQLNEKRSYDRDKLAIDKEKLATQRSIADKNLEIARENKNKYDVKTEPKSKKKKEK